MTGEPVSHCALQFGNYIIHSNLLGVHIEWAPNFLKHAEVVYQLSREKAQDETVLDNVLQKYEFSMYDFGALIFDCLALLARDKLNIPLPKANLWQSSSMFMCTEWIQEYVDLAIDSMITPYKLYEKLKDTGEWSLA